MKKKGTEDVTDFSIEMPEESVVAAAAKPTPSAAQGLKLSADVPVQLSCVLGDKKTSLKEVLELTAGKIIQLDRPPNEIVDLVANGKKVAKGELVEIDGKLGVRIIKLVQ